jgi:hypothetical protein
VSVKSLVWLGGLECITHTHKGLGRYDMMLCIPCERRGAQGKSFSSLRMCINWTPPTTKEELARNASEVVLITDMMLQSHHEAVNTRRSPVRR